MIPVPDETHQTAFIVGLQVDLVEQPNAILEKMKGKYQGFFSQMLYLKTSHTLCLVNTNDCCYIDGTYCVNYQQTNIPAYIPGNGKVLRRKNNDIKCSKGLFVFCIYTNE